MPKQYDFGLDDDGDLDIENDDYTYVLSDEQHIQDTIQASPLWWKQFPADGVGIKNYVNSTGQNQKLSGSIKLQLQTDGYVCNNPDVRTDSNGRYKINPNAIRI